MSLAASKKNAQRFQAIDPDIETLQERLLKSLNTAFDPTAVTKSDDFFLAQDYSLGNYPQANEDPFKPNKSAYQSLTQKANAYVEKAQNEKPLRVKTASVLNKKSDTFLTYVEMEGNLRKNKVVIPEEDDEHYDPLPQITYDGILGDVTSTTGKIDDLEELRKMIRKTKKDMSEYGKELLSLKNNIVDINDYANKELGYGARSDLLHNMENTINTLKDKNEFNYMKKNNSSLQNSKPGSIGQNENTKKAGKLSNIGANPAGPASYTTSKKPLGTGLRATSFKGSFKK